MRLAVEEYQNLDLWAHAFLQDVPLHAAFAIDLPGGGKGRTVRDIHALLPADAATKVNPVVAGLFKIRWVLGRMFGWDDPRRYERHSYLHRLGVEDRARSLSTPGTPDGPFRLLHLLPSESVREVQNATVHAFLCEALRESVSGYRYYWGVYVRS